VNTEHIRLVDGFNYRQPQALHIVIKTTRPTYKIIGVRNLCKC